MTLIQSNTHKQAILIIQFAKWPTLGKVKTRLAKVVGDQSAFDIHIQLTLTVLNNLTSANVGSVELWFDQLLDNTEGQCLVDACKNKSVSIFTQQGNDLGERMHQALAQGLESVDKVIIVGSDCPTVDKDYLMKAVNALNSNDLVLGPAEDGGYVLIGARKVLPMMLDGVVWGGGGVLKSTLSNSERLGLSCALLDTTFDVDEHDDYVRWQKLVT